MYKPILGAFLLLIFCSGCASITSRKQRLKISTYPPGAQVYYKDRMVGTTPGFFEVPRDKNGELRFTLAGQTKKIIKLESSYRWGESFFANFVWFFWGAPIGWLGDLATGAAWEYSFPVQVSLLSSPYKYNPLAQEKRRIVIAPPQTNYVLLSDEVALYVERKLKELYPNDEIIPYRTTQDTFNNYNYDYETKVVPRSRDDLYYELNSTHVAESTIERGETEIKVKGQLVDEFSDKDVDQFDLTLQRNKLQTFTKHSSLTEWSSRIVEIIPNNISYGLKTPIVFFEYASSFTAPYRASLDNSGSILNYLAGLGFKNARNPRLIQGLRPIFRFVPSVTIDYTKIKFDRPNAGNDLNGIGFDWFLLQAGIGPELGLESSIGYFYLQFIPGLGASYISAHGQQGEYTGWSTSFAMETEIGYLVFLSNRINIRLYTNVASGFNQAWGETMSFMTGYNVPVKSASDAVSGLAIGYYFPESHRNVKSWLF